MGRFPVLMYHRIQSDSCPIPGRDREEARYAVDLAVFESHLEQITAGGRRAVSVRQVHDRLSAGDPVPPDWVGMTFDDGNLSDYIHARPLLSARGFSATFFISAERLDAPGGLEPAMLAAMAGEGMDIGSHGVTHRFLTDLSAEDETEEMTRSRAILAEVCRGPVDFYAPPGGRINRRGVNRLKELSYLAVCNSVFGFNRLVGERFEFNRIAITASTPPEVFKNVINGSYLSLAPLYARDRGLRWARRIMGERNYRRVRAARMRS
jgi:peptidoglycan/xylan/chitin deacetylase (PgdA/CDA1 family)